MAELVYIDGKFVPPGEAMVSVDDRGFVFADGVYEVIAVYDGRPFKLPEHLARLARSAEGIQLPLPVDRAELERIFKEGLTQSGLLDAQIYLQITRGVAPRSHPFPGGIPSNLVVTFRTERKIAAEVRERGVSVITTEEIRWRRCDIKSIALLPNVLAAQKAVEEGAFEAVFVTSEGIVHEGARSNIFMVVDNRVYTPPQTENILAGITREVVLQCAQDLGCQVNEETLRIGALLQADEVFLTNTTIQILGVIEVDGKTISSGMVGPVTRRLSDAFLSTLQDLDGCDAFARPQKA